MAHPTPIRPIGPVRVLELSSESLVDMPQAIQDIPSQHSVSHLVAQVSKVTKLPKKFAAVEECAKVQQLVCGHEERLVMACRSWADRPCLRVLRPILSSGNFGSWKFL